MMNFPLFPADAIRRIITALLSLSIPVCVLIPVYGEEPLPLSEDGDTELVSIGLSVHKANYFLPLTYSNFSDDGRKHDEIKFQLSAKQKICGFDSWSGYVAYTQKSFWQYSDLGHSRPFRENNYNPELFVRTARFGWWRVDSGIEHESNGKALPESRGWNRVYAYPSFYLNDFTIGAKIWFKIPRRKKKSPDDPEGDDNPDIQHYYGYGELYASYLHKGFMLRVMGRFNPIYRKGCVNAEMSYQCLPYGGMVLVQYFEGYGESMIDYNVHQRRIGIGVMSSR